MGRFSDLLNKVTDTTVNPGDEDEMANNPRNALADTVNPYLDKLGIPNIPKQTVADDKNFYKNLPEQMAAGTMGTVGAIDNAAGNTAGRFGKILMQGEPEAAQALGKVTVKPTTADLVSDVAQFGAKKGLNATSVSDQVQAQFGPELAKRKADMLKGIITPEAYQSFKQEMTNKFRSQ